MVIQFQTTDGKLHNIDFKAYDTFGDKIVEFYDSLVVPGNYAYSDISGVCLSLPVLSLDPISEFRQTIYVGDVAFTVDYSYTPGEPAATDEYGRPTECDEADLFEIERVYLAEGVAFAFPSDQMILDQLREGHDTAAHYPEFGGTIDDVSDLI